MNSFTIADDQYIDCDMDDGRTAPLIPRVLGAVNRIPPLEFSLCLPLSVHTQTTSLQTSRKITKCELSGAPSFKDLCVSDTGAKGEFYFCIIFMKNGKKKWQHCG